MNHEQRYELVHGIVGQYRADLEDRWKTPAQGDCFRFATCESAENDDALLRLDPAYTRNNDKTEDPLDEVADTLMMLTSAMVDEVYIPVSSYLPGSEKFLHLNLIAVCALASLYYHIGRAWKNHADTAITICLDILGDDAPRRVENRLKRIQANAMANVIAVSDIDDADDFNQ